MRNYNHDLAASNLSFLQFYAVRRWRDDLSNLSHVYHPEVAAVLLLPARGFGAAGQRGLFRHPAAGVVTPTSS